MFYQTSTGLALAHKFWQFWEDEYLASSLSIIISIIDVWKKKNDMIIRAALKKTNPHSHVQLK